MKMLRKTAMLAALLLPAAMVQAGGPPVGGHVQSPVQAPLLKTAQAQAATGYRSFSYQPQAVAPLYYSNGYRSMGRSYRGGHSYENAINKSLGRMD